MALPNLYVRRWDPRPKETYEHQAVAAWKLGIPLKPGEGVHHDDSSKRNNHPNNVWCFSCQRAHMFHEHYQARGVRHLLSMEEVLRVYRYWVTR